jgi:PIN domain nuclease of toxin-antitoxin system
MPIIIDTCVLLWMVGAPKKLSENARRLITENQAGLCVSAISAFEISIKHKKKKLLLPTDPWQWFEQAADFYNLKEIPISAKIAALAPTVNVPHADPCDRIIIASAMTHGFHIVSPDHLIHECPDVQVSW